MAAQSDKERARYYHTFKGTEWTDTRQYDLAMDVSKIGVDRTMECIMKYLE